MKAKIILPLLFLFVVMSAKSDNVKTFLDCNFNEPLNMVSKEKNSCSVIYENCTPPFIVREEQPGKAGNYFMCLTRQQTRQGASCMIGGKNPLPDKRNYELSTRVNLKDKGACAIWFCGSGNDCIGGIWLRANRLLAAYNEKKVWVPSGIDKTPMREWFDLIVKFDVVSKKYQITMTTADGKKTTSKAMPFLSRKPFQKVRFISSPPKGTSALFDNLKVTYSPESVVGNRVNAMNGAEISIRDKSGRLKPVPILADNNIRDNAIFHNLPVKLYIDLAKPTRISTIRLYDGAPEYHNYQSGICRISKYKIEGLNTAGQWRKLAERKDSTVPLQGSTQENMYQQTDFHPVDITKLKVTIYDSTDTLRRSDGTKVKQKSVILREIGLWGKELPAQGDLDNQFKKNIYGEFRLPVYQKQSVAGLHLYNIRKDKNKHRVRIELRERYSGKLVQKAFISKLKYGKNVIEFKLDKLPDGEYAAAVIDYNNPKERGGKFRRLLRLQRLDDKVDRSSPVGEMSGKKMLFPDAHYLEKYANIKFSGAKAKVKQIIKPNSVVDGFIRHGYQLFFDKTGKMYISFFTADRFWSRKSKKDFIAVSSDMNKWTISKSSPKFYAGRVKQKSPLESSPPLAAKPDFRAKNAKAVFHFYDPEKDGKVNLNQVFIEYVKGSAQAIYGAKAPKWKIITPPPYSTWPVWYKAPGEAVLLSRGPLLRDGLSYGEFEDAKDSNDNMVGQWLSDNGKILSYARARKLKRYPPFTAQYDNLANCSRILSIVSTKDGINWKYSYMVPPDLSDPPVAQHYGARAYRIPQGNGLRQAFIYRYYAKSQQISIEIAYSWDGRNWHRYSGQPAFIETGKPKSWNGGMIFINRNAVERNGVVYQMLDWVCQGFHFYGDFYYNRTDMSTVTGALVKKYFTGRDLESWPFFKQFGGYDGIAADIRKAGISIGMASYRSGGLFYMSAKHEEQGSFVSRLLTASSTMSANIIIDKGGFFSIELIDVNGKLIPGYSKKLSCVDNIDLQIFKHLPNVPFKIKVKLKNTKLFSLNF